MSKFSSVECGWMMVFRKKTRKMTKKEYHTEHCACPGFQGETTKTERDKIRAEVSKKTSKLVEKRTK